MVKYRWMLMLIFIVLVPLMVAGPSCDDDDDDDDDDNDDDDNDDDDMEDPATFIITSGYGDEYYLFSGDTYNEMMVVDPLEDTMHGLNDATILPMLGENKVLFTTKPEGASNFDYFSVDAFTGGNIFQMTSYEKPAMGDAVPAGEMGMLFVGVPAGATPILLTQKMTDASPSELRGALFQKALETDPCHTRDWESPAYAPNGNAIATGWHCKDEDGPELPEYTVILAFEPDDEDCGDPIFFRDQIKSVQDVCFTYDSSMVIFSLGAVAEEKEVFAALADGSMEEPQDVTANFNNGNIINFDCDPTSGRIVYNDLETNPNLYVMTYDVGDESLSFGTSVEQITTGNQYRRPRWVNNSLQGQ